MPPEWFGWAWLNNDCVNQGDSAVAGSAQTTNRNQSQEQSHVSTSVHLGNLINPLERIIISWWLV